MQLLDPEVVLLPDAAAVGMGSLREHGARPQWRARCRAGRRARSSRSSTGSPRSCGLRPGKTRGVVQFTIDGDRIVAIDVTGDAERIRGLDIVLLDA